MLIKKIIPYRTINMHKDTERYSMYCHQSPDTTLLRHPPTTFNALEMKHEQSEQVKDQQQLSSVAYEYRLVCYLFFKSNIIGFLFI